MSSRILVIWDSKRFLKYCYWLKIGFVVGFKITTEKLVSVCKSVLYGSLLMSISILKGTVAQRPSSSSKQRIDRSFPYTRSLLLSTSGGTSSGQSRCNLSALRSFMLFDTKRTGYFIIRIYPTPLTSCLIQVTNFNSLY